MNYIQREQVENAIQNAKLDSGISPIGAVLDKLLPDSYIRIVQGGTITIHVQEDTAAQELQERLCNIVDIFKDLEKTTKIRIKKIDAMKKEDEYIGQLPQNKKTISVELPKEVSDWLKEHSSCMIEVLNCKHTD